MLTVYAHHLDQTGEHSATLYHGGRFQLEKLTLPPHPIKKSDDDMDVNSDDEEHRPAPLNKAEEAELYGEGEVVEMSQMW